MMVAAVVVVVLVLLLRRRARRLRTLAGLSAARPVFSIEPPARRVGKRSGEAL